MFGLKMFLGGTLIGTCAGLFVAHYHVVNSTQGLVIVPRTQRPPLRSTYVDIRSWSPSMWVNHPEVTEALIADGRSSLIQDNLKDKLLDEVIPKQTQDDRPRRSRNVASQTEVPIPFETDRIDLGQQPTEQSPATGTSTRLLDSQSPVRKRFESAFDEAIAPMVEDDSAELASDPNETAPADDAMIQKLESRFGEMVNRRPSRTPSAVPSRVEVLPTSGDTEQMARDLLQQVIPQGSNLPRSAAPLRDIGRDLLSAPAPGQGGASLSIPRAATQSQLILSEPF